ncbi:cupin domain-containing protein [Rhodoplanes sp. TEM]|uniref:Cupin domain-containing protein n=1 Tax=Rhodoplanes tepidamans TaxID=200616 RepID=A0ABT5JAM3_RHOTP|nr:MULTISPECIES: cupin domain-containing protein [Rhodoplanes]MDC7786641.1 cupin domain-containing protein [Rhodoplanes tepidamans]MDC7983012.1 cupin domain-containing protein [Rhodoplanes sp. TEM]MDQ0356394.1 quercetin dioxygenase-like cupin family protein [Rhodoplanes tepidamans]
MIRKNVQDIPAVYVDKEGFNGMSARFALTKDDGCPNYAMRVMEFAPGGHTSLHSHLEEHEFFFPEGEPAIVDGNGKETRLKPGDLVYTAPNEVHQLRNLGASTMRVICTIPILPGGDGKSTRKGSEC